MAEITKIKGGVIVECDCGATHKITLDENKELKTKSTYKKKDEDENKRKPTEREQKRQNDDDDDEDESGIFF
ncbi:MAG: hypothetical protein IT232_08585 [Flavobacteriales bacterium]|nr:hypothetical protein [Flavobacteriales bacterium]